MKTTLLVIALLCSAVGTWANEIHFTNPSNKNQQFLLDTDGEGVHVDGAGFASINVPANSTNYVYTFTPPLDQEGGRPMAVFLWSVNSSYGLTGNSYVVSSSSYNDVLVRELTAISTNITLSASYREPTADTLKTLWKVDDTTLTADLFREGVDKIVATGPTSGSSGTSTNADYMATQERNYFDNPSAGFTTMLNNTFLTNAIAVGNQAKTDFTTNFNNAAQNHQIDGGEIETVAVGDSDWTIVLHLHGRDVTIDFNPANYPKLNSAVVWIRRLIAWGIFVVFEFWLWTELRTNLFHSIIAQPAKGNPVAGGTGAQVTSLVVAVLVTGIIVTIPVLYWTYVDSNLGWRPAMFVNPMEESNSTVVDKAIYLAQYCFPVGTALSATTTCFAIRKFGLLMVIGVFTVIRFFVA